MRRVLFVVCSLFAIASCSRATDPSPVPAAPLLVSRVVTPGTYRVVYRFKGGSKDGATPVGSLLASGGVYGVTSAGGANGVGTVYEVGSRERVLYSFKSSSGDANTPQAGLIAANGMLYGTSTFGGTFDGCAESTACGTVFAMTASGQERVLYSFEGNADGDYPDAPLLYLNGELYGTTEGGGFGSCPNATLGCGTVFSVDSTTGEKFTIYTFQGVFHANGDGNTPQAALIAVNGVLYGTTAAGGTANCDCGTVFSLSTAGNESVLHQFGGGSDGSTPSGPLLYFNGAFYGTTKYGGKYDEGTVYEVSPSGSERIVHSFGRPKDGQNPSGPLISVNGALYGTTGAGGSTGYGTIFEILATGGERVLYTFSSVADGVYPGNGLTLARGALFGTASGGDGNGIVFRIAL